MLRCDSVGDVAGIVLPVTIQDHEVRGVAAGGFGEDGVERAAVPAVLFVVNDGCAGRTGFRGGVVVAVIVNDDDVVGVLYRVGDNVCDRSGFVLRGNPNQHIA